MDPKTYPTVPDLPANTPLPVETFIVPITGIPTDVPLPVETTTAMVPITGTTLPGGSGVVVSLISNANLPGQEGGVTKGSLARDFEWRDARTGEAVTLSSLRGKGVFINFWGTWCPPCKAEMPVMQKLYDTYQGEVEFIGVSMGPRDNTGAVKSFAEQYGYRWRFVHDDNYDVATQYEIAAVPTSYFINKDGVISAVHVGGMNREIMEGYLKQVK